MLNPPFTIAQFFAVFANYNAAIWPLQIFVYALGVLVVITLWRGGPLAKHMILSTLAIIWAVNALGYHLLFFAAINPVANVFAAVFFLQSILFAAAIWRLNDLRFEVQRTFRSAAALSIIIYALLIYELLGYTADRGLMAGPLFGVAPCPTTIFTIGVLLLARGRFAMWLSIIPLVWSLVGLAAALQLDVPEDLALPVAGAMLLIKLATDGVREPRDPLLGVH